MNLERIQYIVNELCWLFPQQAEKSVMKLTDGDLKDCYELFIKGNPNTESEIALLTIFRNETIRRKVETRMCKLDQLGI